MEQENKKILIQMNFPAPLITKEEVVKVLEGDKAEYIWTRWLESFLGLPQKSFTKDILERFREINTSETFMSIVPSIQKLLNPLKDSCKAYCLGLHSSSIALTGIAAESLEILLWEMHELNVQGSLITKNQEKAILGRKFERLEQNRRIEVLDGFGWITAEQKKLFHHIREARNRYLHSWNQNFDKEKEDSLLCYKDAFRLLREITGVKLKDASSFEANPLIIKWMDKNLEKK